MEFTHHEGTALGLASPPWQMNIEENKLTLFSKGGKSITLCSKSSDFCLLEVSRGVGPRQLEIWLQENASSLVFTGDAEAASPVVLNTFCKASARTIVAVARCPPEALDCSYGLRLAARCVVKGTPPERTFQLPFETTTPSSQHTCHVQVLRSVFSNTAGSLSLIEVCHNSPVSAWIPRQFRKQLKEAGFPVVGTGKEAEAFRGEKLAYCVTRLELFTTRGSTQQQLELAAAAEPVERLAIILDREEKFSNGIPKDERIIASLQSVPRPVEYERGYAEFDGLQLIVKERVVMIPRPGSATLVQRAVEAWSSGLIHGRREEKKGPRILDLGTGSGCLLFSLLSRLHTATGVGVDISNLALEVAEQNADKLGLSGRCKLQEGSFVCPNVTGTFDLVVCNPPYHRRNKRKPLEARTLLYEPHVALFVEEEDKKDYIVHYRDALVGIEPHIAPGGTIVVFEVFKDNVEAVTQLFELRGVSEITVGRDPKNHVRSIQGVLVPKHSQIT